MGGNAGNVQFGDAQSNKSKRPLSRKNWNSQRAGPPCEICSGDSPDTFRVQQSNDNTVSRSLVNCNNSVSSLSRTTMLGPSLFALSGSG